MKFKLQFTLVLLLVAGFGFGQKGILDAGLEVQVYPTGIIPGLRFEKNFTQKDLAALRLGYQFIDHRDQGKHDTEKGTGFGGTLGYKRYFKENFVGPSLGIRSDLWANKIDWESKLETGEIAKGTTNILVVQPTLEFGWGFPISDKLILTPTAAFGFEFNVKTKGEATGEGAIILAGLTASYRIN